MKDANALRKLTKESSDLAPVVTAYGDLKAMEKELTGAEELLADPDFRSDAEAEIRRLKDTKEKLEAALQLLLLPKDPNDDRNTVLEIRSGEGGVKRRRSSRPISSACWRATQRRSGGTSRCSA